MIWRKYKKHTVPFIIVIVLITIGSAFSQIDDDLISTDEEAEKSNSIIEPRTSVGRNTGNNHKPMFVDCANYSNTVIEEEQPRGLKVTTVHATDDDPPESGGIVTYSIIQREGIRSHFTIDNVTGEITTATIFDRDEPSRQKEVYLTVRANDNGWPVLADICTFKITISDINDNPPQLDKLKNEASVSEDLKVDREVMRVFAYDIDDGDNARLTYALNSAGDFDTYFRIDNRTGVIYLKNSLVDKRRVTFTSQVIVNDNPIDPLQRKQNSGDIKITVVGSDKQLPSFIEYPKDPIYVKESFNDFDHAFATITAQSNIESQDLRFELIRGHTTQTNKDSTFKLTPISSTSAQITLGRQLDYETVTEYQLTVRVENKDSLAAAITIEFKIEDVNDEIPDFVDIVTGSVLENEEPPAEVMQVRAIDKDGTSANNIVSYELGSHDTLFQIDPNTGKVVTKVSFDREMQSVYNVIIIARDNSQSALRKTPGPNLSQQTFRITIEDKNDNKPEFVNSTYRVDNLPENTDIGFVIIEVKANDRDTASIIEYSIVSGNEEGAFMIEKTTGRIRVNSILDYEKTESYNLTIEASDGVYHDDAKVFIFIDNINDELPIFYEYDKNITGIQEEKIYEGCIITLKAYDPDIKDRNAPQNIVYQVDDKYRHFLKVDDGGCVQLTKPLDRDKPNGSPSYQAFIIAYDNNNSQNAQSQSAEIFIILDDINDNAPFLISTEVVWMENQEPGRILIFEAKDYDSEENGPPFAYSFADSTSEDIRSKFEIRDDALYASVMFDREEQKYYDLLINITDSGTPHMSGTSILHVIIGDVNDNKAEDGESEIFVYKYEGASLDIVIGRIFVEDLDDWDLPDKVFQWHSSPHENFNFSRDGMLTMFTGTQPGEYILKFKVTEEAALIPRHTVQAIVNVTVRNIPREAVMKSGSMRLQHITTEDFVTREEGVSLKDTLHLQLVDILNATRENIDIFTVLRSPNSAAVDMIDVRFSAHGSPYYAPERLNSKVSLHLEELERKLNAEFVMISISECIEENICAGNTSCANKLEISDEPAFVFTNRTSFVGVNAFIKPICECKQFMGYDVCYNGGTYDNDKQTCVCPPEYEGPNCEALAIGFKGNGWAMYPTFEACNNTRITLEVTPEAEDGLIFYAGPLAIKPKPIVEDFMSLELNGGFPLLYLNYGSDTRKIPLQTKKLTDGASHTISIWMTSNEVTISVDDCHRSNCLTLGHPSGPNSLLNVNGPLQVGGTRNNLEEIAALLNWRYIPTSKGFVGCIRNLTYNEQLYNLGVPGEQLNAISNCNWGIAKAVTFGIDSNFLVAILVCIAILLILLLAVVVHRRKENNWNEKDADDICENIISYEDEGGGEVDTGFDMSVLKMHDKELTSEPPIKENLYNQAPEAPDISAFLNPKKDNCDRDPNSYPFDDVRYYAYEGDGNSTGSLSSLASCTDDGDLKFNYLSSFGPRFRKLADMYGEDPSDEDSHDGGEESWC